jgi:hypothetical protein
MKKSNAIAAWTFVLLLVTLASIHVQAKVHSGTSLTPQKQNASRSQIEQAGQMCEVQNGSATG